MKRVVMAAVLLSIPANITGQPFPLADEVTKGGKITAQPFWTCDDAGNAQFHITFHSIPNIYATGDFDVMYDSNKLMRIEPNGFTNTVKKIFLGRNLELLETRKIILLLTARRTSYALEWKFDNSLVSYQAFCSYESERRVAVMMRNNRWGWRAVEDEYGEPTGEFVAFTPRAVPMAGKFSDLTGILTCRNSDLTACGVILSEPIPRHDWPTTMNVTYNGIDFNVVNMNAVVRVDGEPIQAVGWTFLNGEGHLYLNIPDLSPLHTGRTVDVALDWDNRRVAFQWKLDGADDALNMVFGSE